MYNKQQTFLFTWYFIEILVSWIQKDSTMWVDWEFHDSKILKMPKINEEYTRKPNWLYLDGDTYIYIGNYLLQDKNKE